MTTSFLPFLPFLPFRYFFLLLQRYIAKLPYLVMMIVIRRSPRSTRKTVCLPVFDLCYYVTSKSIKSKNGRGKVERERDYHNAFSINKIPFLSDPVLLKINFLLRDTL